MHTLRKQQVGAASMITVIFVSIVLTILSLGFIRLAINEQRASTDDDLSTRAYFAAESGIEDIKRALREVQEGTLSDDEVSGNLNQNECIPPDPPRYPQVLSAPEDYDIEYVCQLIDLTPGAFEHYFDGPNQTIQFPIKPLDSSGVNSDFNRLTISWHMNAPRADLGDGVVGVNPGEVKGRSAADYSPPGNQPTLPNVTEWLSVTNNYPAMLRVNLFSHPNSASPWGRANITNNTVFLDPVIGGSGSGSGPSPVGSPASKNAQLADADCDYATSPGEMFCTASFNIAPGGDNWYLRVTSLYRDTHIRVTISRGGSPRFFDEVQAVADVTARAGEVYRRVESRISLVLPNIFPDAALTSLNDICKDFFITTLQSDFDGLNGTSCTIP